MVDTDMGKSGAASLGMTVEQLGAISPSDSVRGILSVVDVATKNKHGGRFWSYTGDEMTY
jgi:norsolorinic acid ketoreductase